MEEPQVHLLRSTVQSQVHHQVVFLLLWVHFFLEAVTLCPSLGVLTACELILSRLSILQQASPNAPAQVRGPLTEMAHLGGRNYLTAGGPDKEQGATLKTDWEGAP